MGFKLGTSRRGSSQRLNAAANVSLILSRDPVIIEYLVVDGGAGAGYITGGGGAGGFIQGTYGVVGITNIGYTITVGSGGAATSANGVTGTPGANSSISGGGLTVTAIGGGGGGYFSTPSGNGLPGGSGGGGGGAVSGPAATGGAGTVGQGNAGGNGGTAGAGYAPSGGGGGAGAVGGNTSGNNGGNGGNGLTSTLLPSVSSTSSNTIGTGTKSFTVASGLGYIAGQAIRIYYDASNYMWGSVNSYTGTTLSFTCIGFTGSGTYTSWTIDYAFAGGGGGTGEIGGKGGLGGGATGDNATPGSDIAAGLVNSGGGGAPGWNLSGSQGGSGVVIFKFPPAISVLATTGSPTITTDGSYNIYKFTSSGSITF